MGKELKSCIIISGAPEDDIDYYNRYINDGFVICADSGYLKCLKAGVTPNLIIGDFDSSKKPDTNIETIILPVRKDDTDTFFAVKEAQKRGFDDIIILGGIGSRIDHTYANILSVNYCVDKNIKCRLVNKNNCISIVNGDVIISNQYYKYFSLYALFDDCKGLTIKGSQFDVDDITLKPFEQFAQSNSFNKNDVEILINEGKLLLIQSND